MIEGNENNDLENLEELDDITAVDLALKLSEYDDDELEEFLKKPTEEELAGILEEAELDTQLRILKFLDNKKILKVFSYMSKDDIVDILGEMNVGKSKELINLMKSGDRAVIKELLGYKDDCAGGIMTTEYIALNANLPIEDAIKKIKEIAPKTELIDTIFVVNRKKELIGTAQLRDILVAPENEKLEEITNEHFVYVDPETDQEEVALIVSKYDLTAIPVLNKKKAMLGIITIDDIVDVIASATIKVFESTIAQVVALSSIMSIITGMGGNAGTQTISIIIRNIAMGKVSLKDSWHLLGKEILLGVIDGAVIGIVTSGIVSIMYGNYYLGIIAFLAMVANLIISGVSGILIPLILQKLKIDPALSSSIFLTTATDVLGFFIFLSLAKIFLVHLM